jgi:cytochrome c
MRTLNILAAALISSAAWAQPTPWHDIGRDATPAEVKAWDIDVRPDFKGLPKGAGTVQQGEQLWEAQCASCHGSFGESNEVFTPIVGGTTKADIERGRVKNLEAGST